MHSKEGVTQEDPLHMIEYGIGILLIIREICAAHPLVTQMWYEDDTVKRGKLAALQEHIRDSMMRGNPRGYFQETTNMILVI